MKSYKYVEAWRNFDEIYKALDLENFDLSKYQEVKKKESIHNYDEYKLSNLFAKRKNSDFDNQVKERKILIENTNLTRRKTENSENSEKVNLDNETESIKEVSEFITSSEISSTFKVESDDFNKFRPKIPKVKSSHGLIDLRPSLERLEEQTHSKNKENHIQLIKQIISYDNLKYLMNIYLELKALMDKKTDPNTQEIDLTPDLNSKLFEYLKINMFNEVLDNISTKIINNTYKIYSTDKEFTSKIENILVHFFKVKNKFNYHSVIDLECQYFFYGKNQQETPKSPDARMTKRILVLKHQQTFTSEDRTNVITINEELYNTSPNQTGNSHSFKI
jgi:hypothetical protein